MAFNLGDVLKNVPNSDTGREQITYLPIDNLDSDAGNFYELTGIDALADNISVAGLQQPIRVRAGREPGRYTIVSGHRRMAACHFNPRPPCGGRRILQNKYTEDE